MNVRPKNYSWPEFYDQLVDVTRYSFSWRAIARRIPATPTAIPKWMNVVRAMSSEGWGRIAYHDDDPAAARHRPVGAGLLWRGRPTCCRSSTPRAFGEELGPVYEYLPKGALYHDPNAYLHATTEPAMVKTGAARRTSGCISSARTDPPLVLVTARVRAPLRPSAVPPPRNSKCSSVISRSPAELPPVARCQSRSFCPTVVAGSQTPGSTRVEDRELRPKPRLADGSLQHHASSRSRYLRGREIPKLSRRMALMVAQIGDSASVPRTTRFSRLEDELPGGYPAYLSFGAVAKW